MASYRSSGNTSSQFARHRVGSLPFPAPNGDHWTDGEPSRIRLEDTIVSAIAKLAEGNPGTAHSWRVDSLAIPGRTSCGSSNSMI
jgi:hypothetical protein